MTDVEIDNEHIDSRVKDWERRIEDLYSLVKETLYTTDGLKFTTSTHMRMYEELMQEFKVAPIDIPIFDIYKNSKLIATFKPHGLWVIGANGRIDILTESSSYILVDEAENFQKPKWRVYSQKNRKNKFIFNAGFIRGLVSEK